MWLVWIIVGAAVAVSLALLWAVLRRRKTAPGEGTVRSSLLYERCCRYMTGSEAFRDSHLDRDALAEALYTNQVYLSRTINEHAGTSIPHFINRYRVLYAMERFRKDPHLNIRRLAAESGFANTATFNNAFKRLTGESPSVWCAREKKKILPRRRG